jgi:hypothetical protein
MSTNHVEAGVSQPVGQDRGRLLRRSLLLDAVASGALGVLLVAAGPALDDLLGIPVAVLMPVGLFLVAYAALLWILGARRHLPTPASWAVVVGNLLWVARQRPGRRGRLVDADRCGHRARRCPGRGRALRRPAVPRTAGKQGHLVTCPPRRFRVRAGIGATLIILGGLFVAGGIFVPPAELLRDPRLIPMPERLLGLWVIAVGVLLLLPLGRRRSLGDNDSRRLHVDSARGNLGELTFANRLHIPALLDPQVGPDGAKRFDLPL